MDKTKNSVDNYVDNMNCFEIFGLRLSYKVDKSALDKAYFDLLRKVHPDSGFADEKLEESCSNSGISDSRAALSHPTPSDLNVAYRVLSNPIDRAEHFLDLLGIAPLRDQLPADFAEEIFELRMRYDSIKIPETKEEKEQKKDFISVLKKRMVDVEDSLESLAEENDLKTFRDYTGLLRFLNSFLEKIDLDDFGY